MSDGERIGVPQAALRSINHGAYRIGQIVPTARLATGEEWQTRTIARGESEKSNQKR